MAVFLLREVDGEFKAARPWYDYLACSKYVVQNGGTLEQAQDALFHPKKESA